MAFSESAASLVNVFVSRCTSGPKENLFIDVLKLLSCPPFPLSLNTQETIAAASLAHEYTHTHTPPPPPVVLEISKQEKNSLYIHSKGCIAVTQTQLY